MWTESHTGSAISFPSLPWTGGAPRVTSSLSGRCEQSVIRLNRMGPSTSLNRIDDFAAFIHWIKICVDQVEH
jgi:hypothetical protein